MRQTTLATALLVLSAVLSVAQNTLRVPDNYATIQDAVNAASPGDTILVSSGTWCGAVVTKRLFIRGEGQAAISGNGCSGPLSSAPLGKRVMKLDIKEYSRSQRYCDRASQLFGCVHRHQRARDQ